MCVSLLSDPYLCHVSWLIAVSIFRLTQICVNRRLTHISIKNVSKYDTHKISENTKMVWNDQGMGDSGWNLVGMEPNWHRKPLECLLYSISLIFNTKTKNLIFGTHMGLNRAPYSPVWGHVLVSFCYVSRRPGSGKICFCTHKLDYDWDCTNHDSPRKLYVASCHITLVLKGPFRKAP